MFLHLQRAWMCGSSIQNPCISPFCKPFNIRFCMLRHPGIAAFLRKKCSVQIVGMRKTAREQTGGTFFLRLSLLP